MLSVVELRARKVLVDFLSAASEENLFLFKCKQHRAKKYLGNFIENRVVGALLRKKYVTSRVDHELNFLIGFYRSN